MVIEAKEQGCKSFILPGENETEGRLVKGIEILPADNLEELCAYLNGAARSEKSKRKKKKMKNRQHRARRFCGYLRTESGETCSRNCSGRRAQFVNGWITGIRKNDDRKADRNHFTGTVMGRKFGNYEDLQCIGAGGSGISADHTAPVS